MTSESKHPAMPQGDPLFSRAWKRKGGSYDFARFANLGSTSPSLGHRVIGKVKVDCRLLFKKSRWGTLGSNDSMAGIVYLELSFQQPIDCKLRKATIRLTLDELDGRPSKYHDPQLPSSSQSLSITDYYGPKYLVGTPTQMHVSKHKSLHPSAEVAGFGASLGSVGVEKHFPRESRWTFKSDREPGHSRIINWEITENDIAKHPLHSHRIYTAFAYSHDGQPFFMHVEVSGKLYSVSDSMKVGLKKIFSPRGTGKDVSTTLVGGYKGKRWPLDEQAQGLEYAMQLENRIAVPVELPDADIPIFRTIGSVEPTKSHIAGSQGVSTPIPYTEPPRPLPVNISSPQLQQSGDLNATRTRDLGKVDQSNSTEPMELSRQNLERAGLYFSSQRSAFRERYVDTVSEISQENSIPTLVESQRAYPEDAKTGIISPKSFDQETVERMMESAFMRMVLCWILFSTTQLSALYRRVSGQGNEKKTA